jgi:hypothetical protein
LTKKLFILFAEALAGLIFVVPIVLSTSAFGAQAPATSEVAGDATSACALTPTKVGMMKLYTKAMVADENVTARSCSLT